MPSIKHKTYIKVSPRKVFTTLLSADEWNAWFTDDTTIHLNGDGKGEIRFRWTNKIDNSVIEDGGEITEMIPNERLVFQWSPAEQTTNVYFELSPFKEGTLLTLTEEDYAKTDKDLDACIECATGWGEALTLLKVYLELGFTFKEDLILA
ncbi:SRPBCC domain-containing protein [Cytobacillus sp. FJAT-54145]|uniref:SRPBCC domain-containing protein n=1 Tax=Cytobacillus spartinae TaxID=3299023 RepID=A0ABW6KAS2_9BACI